MTLWRLGLALTPRDSDLSGWNKPQPAHYSGSPTDAETHTDLECITFKIPFYRWSGSIHAMWFEPELTPPQERSPHDKAFEILELMHKNNWKRSEVANHLGLSRARVTQMLNVLKIPQEKIDVLKKRGVKITERILRDLER